MNPCHPAKHVIRKWLTVGAIAIGTPFFSIEGKRAEASAQPAPTRYDDSATGLSFPQKIGNAKLVGVTEYENRAPGLGHSISYVSPKAKIEVYIYDWGAAFVTSGIQSKIVNEAFYVGMNDIREGQQRGSYRDLRFIENRIDSIADQKFLTARFSYSGNFSKSSSLLLVTGFNSKIVKIRLTSQMDEKGAYLKKERKALAQIGSVFETALENGYTGIVQEEIDQLSEKITLVDISDGLSHLEALTIAQVDLINKGFASEWDLMNPAYTEFEHGKGIAVHFPKRSKEASGTWIGSLSSLIRGNEKQDPLLRARVSQQGNIEVVDEH